MSKCGMVWFFSILINLDYYHRNREQFNLPYDFFLNGIGSFGKVGMRKILYIEKEGIKL